MSTDTSAASSVQCFDLFVAARHNINILMISLTLCNILNLDLFAGKSKEAEIKRINKELANIRSKFKGR